MGGGASKSKPKPKRSTSKVAPETAAPDAKTDSTSGKDSTPSVSAGANNNVKAVSEATALQPEAGEVTPAGLEKHNAAEEPDEEKSDDPKEAGLKKTDGSDAGGDEKEKEEKDDAAEIALGASQVSTISRPTPMRERLTLHPQSVIWDMLDEAEEAAAEKAAGQPHPYILHCTTLPLQFEKTKVSLQAALQKYVPPNFLSMPEIGTALKPVLN